jgi:hypothetical protein
LRSLNKASQSLKVFERALKEKQSEQVWARENITGSSLVFCKEGFSSFEPDPSQLEDACEVKVEFAQ